jgi:hypothetical protein
MLAIADDVTDVAAGPQDPQDAAESCSDCREATCSWHSFFLKHHSLNLFVTGLRLSQL